MVKTSNVLYITYDGLTDPLGQSQIIPYLQGLTKYGYKIHILSCEKKNRYQEQQHLIADLLNQSGIAWHPIPYTRKPPVLSTLYDIWHLKSKARKLNNEFGFSIVHCRSYITAFVGMFLKRKAGTKFIFDMRGFWADERVEGRLWNIHNPVYRTIYKYFKRKELSFLIHADYVVTLTEKAKIEISTHFNLKEKTPEIEVIPCCTDTDFFSKKNIDEKVKNSFSEQLHFNPDDLIISYSGSIGTWYMLDEMLDFFKQLCLVNDHAKFLFITHDSPEKILDTARAKHIDTKKIIITKASREQMPVLLSLSHIALFFIKPVYSKMASSPTKMGEIMSMGIPFITNSGVGDIDTFVERTGSGLLVRDFTNSNYNEVIEKISLLLQLHPESIRSKAMAEYSLDQGINIYKKMYHQLTNN
ncbi:MAG TPA: glycosyltransferase [Bacteroidales bacterium]|nr:glycosyltransferase [Bacteroidales bacterium]